MRWNFYIDYDHRLLQSRALFTWRPPDTQLWSEFDRNDSLAKNYLITSKFFKLVCCSKLVHIINTNRKIKFIFFVSVLVCYRKRFWSNYLRFWHGIGAVYYQRRVEAKICDIKWFWCCDSCFHAESGADEYTLGSVFPSPWVNIKVSSDFQASMWQRKWPLSLMQLNFRYQRFIHPEWEKRRHEPHWIFVRDWWSRCSTQS